MSKDFNTPKTAESTTTWLTPPYVLEKLGKFDTDPCAATNRPWDCATKHNYTIEDNGLIQSWEGRVWLNPPCGSEAEAFVKKMAAHEGTGLALIFARTDTKWFQRWILEEAALIFFWKGRIKFCKPDGTPGGTSNAASCLVAWSMEEEQLLLDLQAQGLGTLAYLQEGKDVLLGCADNYYEFHDKEISQELNKNETLTKGKKSNVTV